jgi:type II secretory pathway pseudopilin PulG
MKFKTKQFAFSLVEMIVVLMVATLVVLAVMGIYTRVRANAKVVLDRLHQNRLETEVLHKIAEDIDRLAAPGFDATISFRTKLTNGYHSSRLILESGYYNNTNKRSIYEQIIWQTAYDPFDDALILYRMHDGLNVEDKILEVDRDSSASAGWYIPVASGLTHFELKAQQGENVLGSWTSKTLPKAVRIAVSFEPLQELFDGSVGIPEETIFVRTVAIDRTREIPFQFVKKTFDMPEEDDPNNIPSDDPNSLQLPDQGDLLPAGEP